MYYPTFNEAKEITQNQDYNIIPICKDISGDMKTPMEVMAILKNVSQHCFMLESADQTKRWSRYTFLGFHPKMEITCQNHMMTINDKQFYVLHPHDSIRDVLSHYKSPRIQGLPPFTGGLVGYFAYDYFQYNEPTLTFEEQDEDFLDVDLMLFDQVICFDNEQQKIILIVNIETNNLLDQYQKGISQLETLSTLIKEGKPAHIQPLKLKSDFTPMFNQEQYTQIITTAKKHIQEGDIFQVVLANRLSAHASGSLFDTYRILRQTNASPYMFYFSSLRLEVAGASPETLVKLENKKLYTYPLAGTRPRGETKDEDMRLEIDLLSDEKELAEHNMLVDLGRNDIGKISKLGCVKVESYLDILKFSHVMHIGSTISGELSDQKDALDTIDALLPTGTLSGAPKIKACSIIHQLEKNKRGIYGGAIGYIDFTGNLDTCIAIRIAYKTKDHVYVCSGAGIVYDSQPDKEYQECFHKAAAVIEALKQANGGIKE